MNNWTSCGRSCSERPTRSNRCKDVDKKIAVASQQIDEFYKTRLPAQDSAIYEELGKVAKQSGVKIGQIRSKAKDTDAVGLRPVEIQADFSGGLSATGALHQLAGARSAVLHY